LEAPGKEDKMAEGTAKLVRWVPARFWDDHESRDLADGAEFISKAGGGYRIAFTQAALDELKSDADFYATGFTYEDGAEIRGLIASAKATLRHLAKQEDSK
jgi:hypothetical protein